MMVSEAIERMRAHVERHKHRTGLYVSTDGLQELLTMLDHLKAQNERLIAKEAERIGMELTK
jgi:hypothetical protein